MAVFIVAFPILAGKEDAGRAFAAACSGARRAEFDELQRRAKTSRETWTMQQTPVGTFMLVWFECEDPEAVFTDLATASDDFTVWFRAQILDVTGVDMSVPDDSPPPELVLDWS